MVSFTRRRKQGDTNGGDLEQKRQVLLKVMERNLQAEFAEFKARQGIMQLGPGIFQSLLATERTLFLALLVFRILNAFFVQTYYVPDEYWQSVEVAHHSAFGYGYLAWEWNTGIRSYMYPMIFSVAFRLLSIVNMDNWALLLRVPKLIQAVFAAVTDFYLFKLSQKTSGRAVAKWTLLCQLMSWFVLYSCTRTLTNNVEALLTVLAFYFYPTSLNGQVCQWLYVIWVTLGFVIRPTAVVQFIPLLIDHAYRILFDCTDVALSRKVLTVLRLVSTAGFVLYVSVWIDSAFYGRWTFSAYNFVYQNVFAGISSFYGTHPWHWYLTQGLPVILSSLLLPLAIGFYCYREKDGILLKVTLAWTVVVYSLIPHKEFRFLYPVLPLAMHFAGYGMNEVWRVASLSSPKKSNSASASTDLQGSSDNKTDDEKNAKQHDPVAGRRHWVGNTLLVILLATNLPLACYTCLIHQRGAMDAMKVVREHATEMLATSKVPSVLFLMPCHSTPFYSHVHLNISMRFLTCEPPLNVQNVSSYVDEADAFYTDPMVWLNNTYPPVSSTGVEDKIRPFRKLPTLILLFADLQRKIRDFLIDEHYAECARIFHTHFATGRLSTHILAFCLREPGHNSINVNK